MKKYNILLVLFLTLICEMATAQSQHIIRRLSINSNQSDFGVSFVGDSSVVFASSRKWKGDKLLLWKGNGEPFLDLYMGKMAPDREIGHVKKFGGKSINTEYHESNAVFTKDSSTVYFSRNNYFKNKFKKDSKGYSLIQMYKGTLNPQGEWDIEPMPFNSDDYQTGHPALNKAENKLYFVSDMPGTYGKTDIFVVDIHGDGTYGEPKNLGPEINTYGKEMFPFIDGDGYLFFSSDGYPDASGLDIYVSKLDDNDMVMGAVKNIGTPINSSGDDFAMIMKTREDWGYFSSNRSGKDDIYYYEFYEGFDLEEETACMNLYVGTVKEEGTDALLPGALVYIYDVEGNLLESVRSNDLAKYAFKLPCKEGHYRVVISKTNYQDVEGTLDTSKGRASEDIVVKTDDMKPHDFVGGHGGGYLMVDNLNPIYFDLDKSDIRIDAAIEIEKVVRIMEKYPALNIEVAAHTDSRADDRYNKKLSDARAKSTKDWLIGRGISSSRISSNGYGESQLLNKCGNGIICSESEHQINRRVEFVVKNPSAIRMEPK